MRLVVCIALAGLSSLLAACAPWAPSPASAAAAPAPVAEVSPVAPTTVAPATPAAGAPAIAPAAQPSFDCAAAADESEKMVCADPVLAALDRHLASVYADALTAPGADTAALKAAQHGWIRGRADCWKADDKPRCVREAYLTQLVQLQLDGGKVQASTPVAFRCVGSDKRFTVAYYNDLDPRAAVITLGSDHAIAFTQPAASGARYGRVGLDVWEHQGEAAVDFYGIKLTCKPVH